MVTRHGKRVHELISDSMGVYNEKVVIKPN